MNSTKMHTTSEEEEEDGTMLCHPSSEDHHDSGGGDFYGDEEDGISDISDEEDEDDDEHLAPPPPVSQHTFAPPFYGRPPTPLPPSPSLTSLLRPSRPTTPDASDDETVANGGAGPEGSSGAEPLPRASPRVPTYEYYGFVLYLFSSLSFLIYLLWAYLPSPFLHALGIYYYPNRWWSLAIPSFLTMTLVYIYVALAAYNTEYLTLPLGSIETIVDEAAQVAVVDSKGQIVRVDKKQPTERRHGHGRHVSTDREVLLPGGGLNWREVWNEGTDAVMDVPLAGVCEVLYGEGREKEIDGSEEEEHDDSEAKSLHDSLANGLVGSRVGRSRWG
ncbi:PIG-P-domain-containing protein [Sordaria brevicollis]|uniref:PIG-P-domain-containing protein n=1 Tax=Sordaria brevicollis TaxID=83679 RepID=A0AAE0PAF9_SORBR|nr:PIG-P-domain-containing protein [Sordaria brevicollis]